MFSSLRQSCPMKSQMWLETLTCLNRSRPRPSSMSLTLMLLVANLANRKWYNKSEKWLKLWHMGTYLRVLSESFPMNTNMTGFKWLTKKSCALDEDCLSIGRVNQLTPSNFELPRQLLEALGFNPSNAARLLSSKPQGCKDLWKPSKPCHVGIHWRAPTEYSQMSTNVPRFQSFFSFLHHFVLANLATSSIRVKDFFDNKVRIWKTF